jgi:hypothetical protein
MRSTWLIPPNSRPAKPTEGREKGSGIFRLIAGTKAQSEGLDAPSASRLGSQLWYAGRNSGSPLAGTWNSHERSCSNARVLQWDAEQPRNSPNRVAPSWRGPRVLRRLRQRFVNPKPPPCGAYLPRRTDLGATPAMPACDRLNSTQQETHPMRVTTVVHYVLPFLALVGGAMILLVPRLQNYVVAIYLMLVGVMGINSLFHFVR